MSQTDTYNGASRVSGYKFSTLGLIVFVAATGYGISFPLISIGLEKMGVSGFMIGLNAAMPAIGWIAGSLVFPRLQKAIGLRSLLLVFLATGTMAILGFGVTNDVTSWNVLRLLFGGGLGLYFRGIEYWINDLSTDVVRGRNLGINSACFMLGLAAGSAIEPSLGATGVQPFLIIAAFCIASGSVLLLVPGHAAPIFTANLAWFGSAGLRSAPLALVAVLAYGLYEGVPGYLMPIYAMKNHFGESVAAYTLTAAAIGNLIVPLPLGLMSDRMNRAKLLLATALFAAISTAAMPLTLDSPPLFLSLIALSAGLAGAIYTIALAIIGDRCEGGDLVVANATFGIVYAIGSVLGPLINGAAIETIDTHGLIASATAILALIVPAAFILGRISHRGSSP